MYPAFAPHRSRRPAYLMAVALFGPLLSLCSGAGISAPIDDAAAPSRPAPKAHGPAPPGVWSRDRHSVGAISGDEIRVLVWNVHRGGDDEWAGDFRAMSLDSDLVLLQEAHLRAGFAEGLVGLPRWDMVEAWRLNGAPTGVLTASNAAPVKVRAIERREPLLRTDKSALLTEYRLAGIDSTLLVANVHAINFTADTRAFREQLTAIAMLVHEHQGPVIFCGDLNTWRKARRAIVDDIAKSLSLTEVAFDGPRKQFGRFPLDHVFYRDLDLLSSAVPALDSSDHNPLLVRFRNPGRARDTTL